MTLLKLRKRNTPTENPQPQRNTKVYTTKSYHYDFEHPHRSKRHSIQSLTWTSTSISQPKDAAWPRNDPIPRVEQRPQFAVTYSRKPVPIDPPAVSQTSKPRSVIPIASWARALKCNKISTLTRDPPATGQDSLRRECETPESLPR